ncbi:MAG: hypothetical protein U1F48_19440 [Burkholderiales bacterium]
MEMHEASTTARDASGYVPRIAAFLTDIGLAVEWGDVPDEAFLPGVLVIRNGLRIDRARLRYPSDLLHEAGHLAGLTASERGQSPPVVGNDPGLEMMALAWSYAAAVAIGVPADVLFHADGYKGWGPSLAENFRAGRYVGVPMLQYHGLACEPRQASERGVPPYPHMLRWLRD